MQPMRKTDVQRVIERSAAPEPPDDEEIVEAFADVARNWARADPLYEDVGPEELNFEEEESR